MKKILCLFLTGLMLMFNSSAFACQNYVYTTSTQENYNASSPIGRFENYNYSTPNYYNQTASIQDINVPQSYNRTVTSTQQMVDTREKADKVIDRGAKVLGCLAVVGLITGLVIHSSRRR